MNRGVAIQGIPGSFHHEAACIEFGTSVKLDCCESFEEVVKAVKDEKSRAGLIAIENSIAGAILPNYDLIDRYGIYISREVYLPIFHQFIALKGQKLEDIREVRSHPMALLQCQNFLNKYPTIKRVNDNDTASAAKRIADQQLKGVAAIASEAAAIYYGLEILAPDIQTVKNNYTRFLILSNCNFHFEEDHIKKASLKITTTNKPGSLAEILTYLSEAGFDLTKIQSMPVIEKPWEYAFFIDVVFEEVKVFRKAIQFANKKYGDFKILGEYNRGRI